MRLILGCSSGAPHRCFQMNTSNLFFLALLALLPVRKSKVASFNCSAIFLCYLLISVCVCVAIIIARTSLRQCAPLTWFSSRRTNRLHKRWHNWRLAGATIVVHIQSLDSSPPPETICSDPHGNPHIEIHRVRRHTIGHTFVVHQRL